MKATMWKRVLAEMPLIVILRGILPEEAADIAAALTAAEILCVEVPLNSPDAPASIANIRKAQGDKLMVGAGTVLTTQELPVIVDAGAQFVVSPNTNPAVIAATKRFGLMSLPGFVTPSEAFAAIDAGADALKLFPTDSARPAALRALKEVLPKRVPVFPVGGVSVETMDGYLRAGAAGFGIGSAIYRPAMDAAIVRENATRFVEAWRAHR